MLKLIVVAIAAGIVIQPLAFAAEEEDLCMGFNPEAFLICNDESGMQKVHAYEEKRCAAGRDGMLNETVPIERVEGPTWSDESDLAEMSFILRGQTVTLRNCEMVAE